MRATLQRLKEIIRENENAAAARDEMVRAARDQIARCDELLQRINMRRRLEPDTRTVVERLRVEDFPPEDWEVGRRLVLPEPPGRRRLHDSRGRLRLANSPTAPERQRDQSVMRAEGRPRKLFGKGPWHGTDRSHNTTAS